MGPRSGRKSSCYAVAQLRAATRSDAFRTRWARHNVRHHRTSAKQIHNTVVGDLTLTGDALELPGENLILITYTAPADSPAQEQLNFLTSWTATQFHEPARGEESASAPTDSLASGNGRRSAPRLPGCPGSRQRGTIFRRWISPGRTASEATRRTSCASGSRSMPGWRGWATIAVLGADNAKAVTPSTCGNCPHLHELHDLRGHVGDPARDHRKGRHWAGRALITAGHGAGADLERGP